MIKQLFRILFIRFIRRRFGHLGRFSYISPLGNYLYPKKIFVGDNVYIGAHALISAKEGIHIGNGAIIGPEFMVMGGDHNFRRPGNKICHSPEGGENKPIRIEDDVWIGARCLILKGVTIGEGAVIGAGSVLTENVAPYAIYAGNPARKINERFTEAELRYHLEVVQSKYTIDDIKKFNK